MATAEFAITRWTEDNFPNLQVTIVYHDDNEGRVPHAHAIANKTSLAACHQAQDAISRKLSGT